MNAHPKLIKPLSPYLAVIGIMLFFASSLQAKAPPSSMSFDFPDFLVGSAEYSEGPTGLTLFYFPQGAQAAVDIRGGSVGTFFTQEKMHQGEAIIDGIALAGGGIVGLEAVSGVVSTLFAQRRQKDFNQMPLITGGVIFDYTPRQNYIYPDKALGKKAFKNLQKNQFKIGKKGAGSSATVGKLFGHYHAAGQGGAFGQWGETKIAVFTVVNAIGVILNDKGEIVYGVDKPYSMEAFLKKVGNKLSTKEAIHFANAGNTTLTVVIINQKLAPRHLQQIGRSVHHALSQVIYPYASILDGDLVYTVSTGTVESDLYMPGAAIETDLNLKNIYLGTLAGDLAKQAVWSAVGYRPEKNNKLNTLSG